VRQAANSAVAAVRTWDDPTASFGLWAPGSGGFENPSRAISSTGWSEKLPLHGRPDLMRKVAAADASREQLAPSYETQKLRRDLQVASERRGPRRPRGGIAEQDLTWLDATLAAVDHRYRVGQASQVDWLKSRRPARWPATT
jgi:hypothetical protein